MVTFRWWGRCGGRRYVVNGGSSLWWRFDAVVTWFGGRGGVRGCEGIKEGFMGGNLLIGGLTTMISVGTGGSLAIKFV